MATIVQQQQYPPPPHHHHHLSQNQVLPSPSSLLQQAPPPQSQPSPIPHSHPSSSRPPISNLPPQQFASPLAAPPLPTAQPPSNQHTYHSQPLSNHSQPPPAPVPHPRGSAKEGAERDQAANGSASSPGRKRPRILLTEDSIVPADDKNEWYYPSAPRPAALIDPEDERGLMPGSSTGNWGKKHVKGARWVRRGKLTDWGPARAEWEMDERARKRLKALIPSEPSRPDSPPLPVLPHLRSPSPPLTAPYSLPPKTHPSYTSFILDHSVQHTYRNKTVQSLENTMTEFIEGEGALRMALGALWRAMGSNSDATLAKQPGESSTLPSEKHSSDAESAKQSVEPTLDDVPPGDDDVSMSGSVVALPTRTNEELLVSSLSPLRQLFVSTSPVLVGPDGAPHATLQSTSQLESYEWGVSVLRDLADDAREYMARLEEVREECGKARAVRKDVWRIVREKALEEMEEEERAQEGDEEVFEEVGSEY